MVTRKRLSRSKRNIRRRERYEDKLWENAEPFMKNYARVITKLMDGEAQIDLDSRGPIKVGIAKGR